MWSRCRPSLRPPWVRSAVSDAPDTDTTSGRARNWSASASTSAGARPWGRWLVHRPSCSTWAACSTVMNGGRSSNIDGSWPDDVHNLLRSPLGVVLHAPAVDDVTATRHTRTGGPARGCAGQPRRTPVDRHRDADGVGSLRRQDPRVARLRRRRGRHPQGVVPAAGRCDPAGVRRTTRAPAARPARRQTRTAGNTGRRGHPADGRVSRRAREAHADRLPSPGRRGPWRGASSTSN